ncbi:C26 family cysteine hydrolase domain-containing family [Candidatus Pacearchaeota archaeon]|nr:C26 family cysteine hydrolase domain-containing family [Candidatus Pacearchaeota archaeon]
MILIINICKEKLHSYEFVRPVTDVLDTEHIEYFVKHYNDVNLDDIKKSLKIIICGTSLKDDRYIKDIKKFKWIKDFEKPILGICGGSQIIGLVYGGRLNKKTEIGFFYERIKKDFLGLNGVVQVYHLHNNYCKFSDYFENYSDSLFYQAVKHRLKPVYCVLFHPEVRQKDLIRNFLNVNKEI